MSQAGLARISSSVLPPEVPTSFVTNSGTAIPVAHILNVLGAIIPAGSTPVFTIGSGNTVTIEVQTSQAIAATDATKIGLSAFNSAMFSVDANGFVSLSGGGQAIDSIALQTGTSPIVPTAAGLINFNGAVVSAGTNPVRTDGTGANTMALEVQISQAIAASDATKIGLSAYDSSFFSVDGNGFVTANGSTLIQKINLQTGTTPITPILGAITFNGAVVAAGTNPVRTDGTAAHTMALEVQTSQAIAATDATKIGLSAYDSVNFLVDANGFVSTTAFNNVMAGNLGFTYAASTFTVTSASGAALSATNPGYVALSGKTAGVIKRIKVTANQSFIDASGASQIIGNLFGLTTGIAFAQDIPFFLYAVLDDTETTVAFMISRYPNSTISPAAANIGKVGSAVADTQASFFSLANITVADYESNPCVSLGSFRMRMNSSDDWTVQALAITDGIGQYQEMQQFNMAVNQFGAAASSFYYANGGTAPQFTTNNYVYKVNRHNKITVYTNFNVVTVAGVGAVNLQLALPFSVGGTAMGSGVLKDNAANLYVCTTQIPSPAPQNKLEVIFANNLASGQLLNNNMTGNALLNHFAYAPIAFI